MNLILMRAELPISNIRVEERPQYYECLGFADVGLYDDLVQMIFRRSTDLFAEYSRIREESKRMEEWATKWGEKEANILLRRETRELELWQSRIRSLLLEFQKATEILDDRMDRLQVDFYQYSGSMDIERYARLRRDGSIEQSNVFAVNFFDKQTKRRERFGFRYFRNWNKHPKPSQAIPLVLAYLDRTKNQYVDIENSPWREVVRLRELYLSDNGTMYARYVNVGSKQECEDSSRPVSQWVQSFFDDVLQHVFGLK